MSTHDDLAQAIFGDRSPCQCGQVQVGPMGGQHTLHQDGSWTQHNARACTWTPKGQPLAMVGSPAPTPPAPTHHTGLAMHDAPLVRTVHLALVALAATTVALLTLALVLG